jgi:hypothetical protein
VQFRFADPILERFYVRGVAPEGLPAPVLGYCLDALAVLAAARGVDDFSSLRAFRPVALCVRGRSTLALQLGDEWALTFTVENDGTDDAMANIKSVCKSTIQSRKAAR